MIRRGLLAILLALFWTPALAQTVAIRSGEHADFSRLVFEFPADVSWTLGRGADGYLLRFGNPALDFALGGVFTLIPRTRLADIRQAEPGIVALAVPDGVHADAMLLRPGVLVLDLRTGPAPADSPFEASLVEPRPVEAARPAVVPARPRVRLPLDIGRMTPSPVIGRFLPPEPLAAVDPPDPRVESARSELMKQIGRAASQGLLQAADITPDRPPPSEARGREPEPEPGSADAETPLAGLGDRPNIHVETSIDRGLGPQAARQDRSALGDPCYPDSYFDLAAWGEGQSPGALIAEGRAALLNMRDATDPAGAEKLVRAYLALGFGTEVRAVIDTVRLDTPPAAVWREVGAIIDEGIAENPALFDGQLSCPNRAALWATLARPKISSAAEVDEAAVIRSFSELPLHLRRHLGPILAERFLASGATEAATRVRNAVARAGDKTRSGDLTIVEARIDLSRGETETAEARIEEVLAQGGPATPEAVIVKIESLLISGQVPEMDILRLAEALAYERRDTPQGMRLVELAIRGHATRGNFQTAFGMLLHHGLEPREDLASDLLRALARDGNDADILREAFSGALTVPTIALTPKARLAAADRLLDLGFAPRAGQIIAGIPPQGTDEERLVRARLALAAGRPGEATQYLSGLETTQAERLRAEAARARGDLVEAARHYGAAGDTARQAALAWRERDWSTVETAGPDSQSGYAAMRQTTPAAAFDPAQAPSLAGARDLLEGSGVMRDRLKDLLARTEPR
ncbi:hypothetical protein [Rhodovulum steppense]|uniref:Tetratricopeptide repeat protein n=1 Tax=Rhodovulum steppense TaxID=540251 RepID=A0A4R1Z0M5_9RHOB|nr:hypothetical protein [Rhodovulum steppense]TCM87067.1 hypothetical protein EV216_103145 [Rhodovulum steppense]